MHFSLCDPEEPRISVGLCDPEEPCISMGLCDPEEPCISVGLCDPEEPCISVCVRYAQTLFARNAEVPLSLQGTVQRQSRSKG